MNRNEWLEARKKGISGSDAAAIVGMNPYMNNVDLYRLKKGLKEQDDISEKEYVKYGNEAEKHLRNLFLLDYPQYGVYHKENEIFVHKKYPFIIGSLDGMLTDKENNRIGVLEIKTTNILQSMHYEKWNNKIPDNYYIQVLHYMLVIDAEFAILKAQLKTKYDNEVRLNTRHYHIERKDVQNDIDYLLEKEIDFWNNYVEKGKEPNLVLPNI